MRRAYAAQHPQTRDPRRSGGRSDRRQRGTRDLHQFCKSARHGRLRLSGVAGAGRHSPWGDLSWAGGTGRGACEPRRGLSGADPTPARRCWHPPAALATAVTQGTARRNRDRGRRRPPARNAPQPRADLSWGTLPRMRLDGARLPAAFALRCPTPQTWAVTGAGWIRSRNRARNLGTFRRGVRALRRVAAAPDVDRHPAAAGRTPGQGVSRRGASRGGRAGHFALRQLAGLLGGGRLRSVSGLGLGRVIDQADVGGNNAPTLRQPHPRLHLATNFAGGTVAIKQRRGDREIATVTRNYGSRARARQVLRWAPGAKRRHLRMAVKVLGETIANGARILMKQRIERGHVVVDERLFVTLECHAYVGDDVRQVNFHASPIRGTRCQRNPVLFQAISDAQSHIFAPRRHDNLHADG